MAIKFTPNFDYIFSLSLEDQKPEIVDAMEELLKAWGRVHRGELLSLGYAAAHIWASARRDRVRSAAISDDEYMALDAALLELREDAPEQTQALSYRYLEGLHWDKVGKMVHRSARVAARRSELGMQLIYNHLAIWGDHSERFPLSSKILGEEIVIKYGGDKSPKMH